MTILFLIIYFVIGWTGLARSLSDLAEMSNSGWLSLLICTAFWATWPVSLPMFVAYVSKE